MTATVRSEFIEEVRSALGSKAQKIFPNSREVAELTRETFQSKTFQKAGYHLFDDERYGKGDRFLYIVTFIDGTQLIVTAGKVSSGNPYEVMHASIPHVDMREMRVAIYLYDGYSTITETLPDSDEINEYTGAYGNPKILLESARRSLGKFVVMEN